MIFQVTRGYCNLVREADKLLVIFFFKKKRSTTCYPPHKKTNKKIETGLNKWAPGPHA
jgi:5-deoxy-D-glucuronate isomerase